MPLKPKEPSPVMQNTRLPGRASLASTRGHTSSTSAVAAVAGGEHCRPLVGGATCEGTDPSEQLRRVEGLDDVVIRAEGQAHEGLDALAHGARDVLVHGDEGAKGSVIGVVGGGAGHQRGDGESNARGQSCLGHGRHVFPVPRPVRRIHEDRQRRIVVAEHHRALYRYLSRQYAGPRYALLRLLLAAGAEDVLVVLEHSNARLGSLATGPGSTAGRRSAARSSFRGCSATSPFRRS